MIAKNELRINNYVLTGHGSVLKIEGIISKGNTGGYLLETLKPIPITEEWLFKFGSKPLIINGKTNHYRIGIHTILVDDNNDFYFMLGKGMDIKIEFIHNLQNLYFALTQKELELK